MSKVDCIKVGSRFRKTTSFGPPAEHVVTKILERDTMVSKPMATKHTDFIYLKGHPMTVATTLVHKSAKSKTCWTPIA